MPTKMMKCYADCSGCDFYRSSEVWGANTVIDDAKRHGINTGHYVTLILNY